MRLTVFRSTNPKEQADTEKVGQTGTLVRYDGTGRPLQLAFGEQKLWYWKADVAPAPTDGSRVTIVRATSPKEAACTEMVGQTGTVLRTDGSGRPYHVGFGEQKLWYWPADVGVPAPPGTKARGYLVPDEQSQIALGQLGFDLRAPKSSFDPDPKVQANPTFFGGAHVSVLGKRGGCAQLTPNCYRQLQVAAELCRQRSWKLPALEFHTGEHQPGYYLSQSDPHTKTLIEAAGAAVRAAANGWDEAKQKGFHVGLYSSTLHERPTDQQAEQMKAVLMKAQWGFVLGRDSGGDGRNFTFDWTTWEVISERP